MEQHSTRPTTARRHMQSLLRCRGLDLAEEHQCLLVDIRDCGVEELPEGGCHVFVPAMHEL